MTRKELEERQEFEEIMTAEQTMGGALPLWSREQKARQLAGLLLRHGKTYARLQEMNCNGVGTWYGESNESFAKRQDRHEKWVEKREGQIERRIRKIVSELGPGFGVIFQGDPRGSTIKITVPSGRTNDWGREGICVPTA